MRESAGSPPLPYRVRPPQVLLGVGATLLVTAAATVASVSGGSAADWALIVLATVSAALSLGASRTKLHSSEVTLAACAAGLALSASDLGGRVLTGSPVTALALAAGFLALHLLNRDNTVWPLASWAAGQLAALRAMHLIPAALHTVVFLTVALVGLGIALFGRPLVARVALVTSAPWWLIGVIGGSSSAWVAGGAEQWLSAGLMVAAAFGLVPARLRKELEPLLGPPRLVPVVAGIVSGAAVTGAFSSLGPLAMTLTGYTGVLIATLPAGYLEGWYRGLLLPLALAAGVAMSSLCIVQLVAGQHWAQISLLLVLTAIPTVLVAVHRPEDRPEAVPTAVACLAGAVLLALPAGLLGAAVAAGLLTALYGGAMTVGAALEPTARRTTAVAAAACAAAAVLLLVARGSGTAVAGHLAVQGLSTLTWAGRTGRRAGAVARASDGGLSAAWRIGATQLMLAAWIAAATADRGAIEWYSLPAAAALLLGAGPRLVRGPSWPAWGPGLLVAAVPSTVVAAATAEVPRSVALLVAAALAMVAGARTGVRAPLLAGAGTALTLTLALAVRQVPWPLGAALITGSVLLALGILRERRPVAGFGARLADLR
ncbi:MAG: hypothetical protein JWP40_1327 [Blastococcus sp.]|nr:hypothetical protein [Blastococcus sp.]